MRNVLMLLALGVMVSPAWAQEEESPPRDEAPREEPSREDRMIQGTVDRLRRSLDLSDEQAEKIAGILKESSMAREEKIRETLSDEQKEQYQGLNAPSSRGGNTRDAGGRGGRPGGGMAARMGGLGNLKEQLGLTDEQMEKIQPMIDEFSQGLMERFQNRDRSQPFDFRAEMEKVREEGEALRDKIKEHLTDEQKTRADELWEQGREMMDRFTRDRDNQQGGQGGRGRFGRTPEQRVDAVMERLAIENEEEAALLREMIVKVTEAQEAFREKGGELRTTMREALESSELTEGKCEETLTAVRAERTALEDAVEAAQKALQEVVTFKQELILMDMGILR